MIVCETCIASIELFCSGHFRFYLQILWKKRVSEEEKERRNEPMNNTNLLLNV